MIVLIWLLTVSLALWFGFELGRKWDAGQREAEAEAYAERRQQQGGIRLSRIVIRR